MSFTQEEIALYLVGALPAGISLQLQREAELDAELASKLEIMGQLIGSAPYQSDDAESATPVSVAPRNATLALGRRTAKVPVRDQHATSNPDRTVDSRMRKTAKVSVRDRKSAASDMDLAIRDDRPNLDGYVSCKRTGHDVSLNTQPKKLGRYKILRLLGRGAMGTVYQAQDMMLHRKVALKIPTFDSLNSKRDHSAFVREAQMVACLSHPNLCQVFDVGMIDDQCVIAMEFVDGKTLSAYTKIGMLLDTIEAVGIIVKIADAMATVHERGLIHRDLKPDNIIVQKVGRSRCELQPKVMDFGVARNMNGFMANSTASGIITGTPTYMAPEQWSGKHGDIGPQCDVYSLGIILYELLTGSMPFDVDGDEPATAWFVNLITKSQITPRQRDPNIDPVLDQIVMRTIAKSQSDRYECMHALAQSLRSWLNGRDLVSPSKEAPVRVNPSPSVATPTTRRDDTDGYASRRGLIRPKKLISLDWGVPSRLFKQSKKWIILFVVLLSVSAIALEYERVPIVVGNALKLHVGDLGFQPERSVIAVRAEKPDVIPNELPISATVAKSSVTTPVCHVETIGAWGSGPSPSSQPLDDGQRKISTGAAVSNNVGLPSGSLNEEFMSLHSYVTIIHDDSEVFLRRAKDHRWKFDDFRERILATRRVDICPKMDLDGIIFALEREEHVFSKFGANVSISQTVLQPSAIKLLTTNPESDVECERTYGP